MQFLRTAFWVVLAVAIALFCKANNRPMEIKIWGDIVWETRIWFPILAAFLLGFVPLWIVARANRWRLKRQLENAEKAIASVNASTIAAASPVPATPIIAPAQPDSEPLPPPSPLSTTGPA